MGLKIVSGLSRPQQRISLCMIVRDEEDNLGRCLRSVESVVDEIIVVDTGSVDATVEIAQRHGARVLHEEWKGDFSGPRNLGIDAASGEWILVLDADEELMGAGDLRGLVESADDLEGFYLREVSYTGTEGTVEGVVHGALRLFRNRPQYRYDGALHEQISTKLEGEIGTVTRFVGSPEIIHYGYLTDAVEGREKTKRNREIALQEALRNPTDGFALFNAGIEYQRIEDHAKAVYFFRQAFANIPDMHRSWVPVLLRALAVSLRLLDRQEDALDVLRDGESAFPDFSDLFFVEALCHVDRSEYRAGIEALRRALEIGDHAGDRYMARLGMGSFHSWYALGVLSERIGDLGEAARAYRQAIVTAKGCFPSALAAFVRLCLTTDAPDVVKDYVVGLLPTRQRADSLRVVAEAFQSADLPEQALSLAEQALEIAPGDHAIQLVRGSALIALGRHEESLTQLEAIPAGSEYASAAQERVFLCGLVAGDWETAGRAIVALAEVEDGLMSFVLSGVLEGMRSQAEPLELPERFSRERGVSMALGLAAQLLGLGRLDEFNAATQVLYSIAEDASQIDESVGIMLYDADFPGPAAARLVAAVEAGVASPEALARLGHLCGDQDLSDDAERFFRAALEADSQNLARYVDLVRVLATTGRYEAAEQVLADGLEVHPHSTVMTELKESFHLLAESVE